MGFYDYRCTVTGVSLKGSDAALVLLAATGKGFTPVALAIMGTYNRLGSIDNIDEDNNIDKVVSYFVDKLETGELVINESHAPEGIEDIEPLLNVVERSVTESSNAFVLNGQQIVYALICRDVWNAIVKAAPAPTASGKALLHELFPEGSVGREIYEGNASAVTRNLKQFAAVNSFLAQRGIPWKPPEHPEQHYGEEMKQYLAEAKKPFHDAPAVLRGLQAYEKRIGWLLEDE
jgi:hypothetical protein